MDTLTREPALRGDTYCSPSCGFGCSKAAFDQATAEAAALVKLLGEGWSADVWENWGWHYAAVKGCVQIHPSISGRAITGGWEVTGYTCYFNTEKQHIARAKEAADALGFATQDVRGSIDKMRADLAVISNDI